jgi:hypothetical protein
MKVPKAGHEGGDIEAPVKEAREVTREEDIFKPEVYEALLKVDGVEGHFSNERCVFFRINRYVTFNIAPSDVEIYVTIPLVRADSTSVEDVASDLEGALTALKRVITPYRNKFLSSGYIDRPVPVEEGVRLHEPIVYIGCYGKTGDFKELVRVLSEIEGIKALAAATFQTTTE